MPEGGVPGNACLDPHPQEIHVGSQEIQLGRTVFGRWASVPESCGGGSASQRHKEGALSAVAALTGTASNVPTPWHHPPLQEATGSRIWEGLGSKGQAEDPLFRATPECPFTRPPNRNHCCTVRTCCSRIRASKYGNCLAFGI